MAGQETRRRRRGGRPPLSGGAAPETTTRPRPSRPRPDRGEDWIYGRHAVAAALANPQRRWRRLAVLSGQEEEAASLVAAARAERRGTADPIEVLDRAAFDAILPEGAVHQGWALAGRAARSARPRRCSARHRRDPGRHDRRPRRDRDARPGQRSAQCRRRAALGRRVRRRRGDRSRSRHAAAGPGARQGRLGRARPRAAGPRRQSGARPGPLEGSRVLELRPRRGRADAAVGARSRRRARCWCSVPRAAGCAGSCASAATSSRACRRGPKCRASTCRTRRLSRSTN